MTIKNLGRMGLPFHERGSQRIWVWKNIGICYSDDYGDSWVIWMEINAIIPQPYNHVGGEQDILRDSQGNIYYRAWQGGVGMTYYRIDSDTKIVTVAFATENNSVVLQWGFTEDDMGNIYCGAYHLIAPTGGHYIYISTKGGNNFIKNDILLTEYPEQRHVHSLQYNPYDGKIYGTCGDYKSGSKQRGFFVSDDGFETLTKITNGTQDMGFTGMTFTSEAIYLSDDLPSADNFLWRYNNGVFTKIWTPPNRYIKAPFYYLRALKDNPNELWMTIVDEDAVSYSDTAVIKFTKDTGVNNPWSVDYVLEDKGPEVNDMTYYSISGNGQGGNIEKDSPYIFVKNSRWSSLYDSETSIIRIKRFEDSETQNPLLKIAHHGTIENIRLYELDDIKNNNFRIYIDNTIKCFNLINPDDTNATKSKISINGTIKAFEKI